MTRRVVIEAQAASDIFEHGRWIAEQGSPLNAARWVDEIESAIQSLNVMAERCAVAPESAVFARTVRQLLFGSHRILFIVESERVHILHVRHGSRLPLQPER